MDLRRGDCLEIMKSIPDNSIDMCLTDPPYGTTQCKWDSVIDFELMWIELKRIVKPNGAICLFGSEPFSSALRMSNIKMFKYDWIWHKTKPSGIAQSKYMPMKSHEIISVFAKQKTNFYGIKESRVGESLSRYKYSKMDKNYTSEHNSLKETEKKQYGKNLLRNPTTVQAFKSLPNNGRNKCVHPTQKPVPLLEYLIKTYTLEGETVLDFTMGSGSTGVAAKNLDRNFIGIEMDANYFGIAFERIHKLGGE